MYPPTPHNSTPIMLKIFMDKSDTLTFMIWSYKILDTSGSTVVIFNGEIVSRM